MGMSASQARFLGLTARKSNVEYEGQQVNQQRTVLGNETANYYNDLLGMSVPVPPSPNDYTKTIYTFEDGALTNTITSMIAQKDGKFKISYMMNWTDDFAAVSAGTSLVTKVSPSSGSTTSTSTTTDYMVGAKTLRQLGIISVTAKYKDANGDEQEKSGLYPQYDSTNKTYKFYTTYDPTSGTYSDEYTGLTGATDISYIADYANTKNDEYLKKLSLDQICKLQEEEKEYENILDKQYGDNSDWFIRYEHNTTSNEWEPIFVKKSVLESTIYDENNTSLSYIPMYTIGSAKKNEEIKQVDARFEQDATGRIINVTLNPDSEDRVTYAVTTSTVTDQAKYDDAMNQYEYDKALYDKAIQETNAKIEIIQTEDKNLELRLKQLDTEQDAIQTEMDAVQKVIEKNTESTFKTFG